MEQVTKHKNNKWHHAEIGGTTFFFYREYEVVYARVLQTQMELGKITWWEYHPTAFEYAGKKLTESFSYKPSFKVIKANGDIRYIEVGRQWTPEFNKKFKKFLKYYPDVRPLMQIINNDYFITNEQKLKDGGYWI